MATRGSCAAAVTGERLAAVPLAVESDRPTATAADQPRARALSFALIGFPDERFATYPLAPHVCIDRVIFSSSHSTFAWTRR
jgi:hypothetical protein